MPASVVANMLKSDKKTASTKKPKPNKPSLAASNSSPQLQPSDGTNSNASQINAEFQLPITQPPHHPEQSSDEAPTPETVSTTQSQAAPLKPANTQLAYNATLKEFVRETWTTLEPVTPLLWTWHLDLICEYLTLIKQGNFRAACGLEKEGIIFNVPPRTMKSLLISVFFPVWVWTVHPARRFMFVSYSEKLSTQHSIFRRRIIESEFYQKYWGKKFTLSRDQNIKSHYENSERGAMFSTGMQATATGMGGDILVFDDPLNPEQAISQVEREAVNLRFDTTFRSRINDPATGVKIIVMQRLHELDLTGHVLGRESDRWLHLSLPATAEKDAEWILPVSKKHQTQKPGELLWPLRLTQSFLDSQRIGMGSWAFNGQYQQRPAPLEGGIIKRAWVRFYRQLPEHFDFVVQSWDCTFSGGSDNDFVAGQVWARSGGKYYMLPYRTYERLDFGPTRAAIKSCHAKFPGAHAILVEDKANGPAIISELQKEIPGIIAVNPEGGKIARAQATAPLWESGSIELPDPQLFDCPWIEDYLHNICTFPKAAHDDDMDSTSQALIYMRSRLGGGIFDFYRQQATGEIAPKRTVNLSQLDPAIRRQEGNSLEHASSANFANPAQFGNLANRGPHVPGSPEQAGFARNGVEAPPPAIEHPDNRGPQAPPPAIEGISDSTLARNVIAAIEQGSQIQCNAKQYPEIRATLLSVARNTSTMNNSGISQAQLSSFLAESELRRLDLLFGYDLNQTEIYGQ